MPVRRIRSQYFYCTIIIHEYTLHIFQTDFIISMFWNFSDRYEKQLEQQTLSWSMVYRLKEYGLQNILALFDLLRTLPPTSVRNECCFSVMKLTKSKRRARMRPDTLNDLLTVSLLAPSLEEYDPTDSVEHFPVRIFLISSAQTKTGLLNYFQLRNCVTVNWK